MRVLMLEGRPSEHPIHREYAKSVGADFLYIDQFLQYQGKRENKILIFLSWMLTSIYLLFNRKYTVYLCGGPCPPLILLHKAQLLSKRKKVISLAANETLFFLDEGKYSGYTKRLYNYWYNRTINGIICIGTFQEMLAKKIILNEKIKIHKIFNGLPDSFFEENKNFIYNQNGNDLICIANGPSGFRVFYKGLDLLIKIFEKYCTNNGIGNLIIVGAWDKATKIELLEKIPDNISKRIHFLGHQASYIPFLKTVGLSVHFSRGDSFPTSNLETLALGIPTIVTNITGTSEIIQKINSDWVAPVELDELEKRIQCFFRLPTDEKVLLSAKAKNIMHNYKHKNALISFKNSFFKIMDMPSDLD